MECLAAIQRGQQHPKQVKPDTHSPSGTTSLVASVGSKVSVQLHATELVAELIANTQQPDAGSAEHPGEPLSTQEPCWGFLKVCFIAFLGLPDVLSSTHRQGSKCLLFHPVVVPSSAVYHPAELHSSIPQNKLFCIVGVPARKL